MSVAPRPRSSVRRRGIAWLTATTLVSGTGALAGIVPTPASHAAPAADCAAAFPVDEIVDGTPVRGFTVSQGTTPEEFTGEILGVLEGGIAPGLDMIIMDLESEAIDAAGGIWQGMSGSPVYTLDGDLIGAVAYGLSWGSSPIAGVTPYEHMDDYLGSYSRPRPAPVDRATARKIAATGEATRAQAEQGFSMLGVATGVSGVGASRLKKYGHSERSYLPQGAYAAGRASADAATADDIVAGSNMAASYSFGDISFAGVGTATSVCDGEVVGFGHPFDFAGETTMSLHPASAIHVQPESLGSPFKIANLGMPVGTVYTDNLAGITAVFDEMPEGTQVTSSVALGDRNRTGGTTVTVPYAAPAVTFYQIIANHDRVLDAITKGSEEQSWTITGAYRDKPFVFDQGDRYTSQFDISWEASYELADLVWLLSRIDGVRIDEVSVDSRLTKDTTTSRVVGNEMKVRGEWVKVNHRNPIRTKPGKLLRLRALVKDSSGEVTTTAYTFKVPRGTRGVRGQIFLSGGNEYYGGDYYYEEGPASFAEVAESITGRVRNDTILASLMFQQGSPYGEDGDYVVVSCKGCRASKGGESIAEQSLTLAQDRVVDGFKRIKVLVK